MAPTDLVFEYRNAERLLKRYGVSQHSALQDFQDNRRTGGIDHFETCVLVRSPLTVVESFYKYGLRQLKSAAQGGMKHFPQAGRSFDDWVSFVQDKLANGDSGTIPLFAHSLAGGAVREAMLSRSFDEYLDRVGDKRWTRYLRAYTRLGDREVAVKTVLKLEDPISIRKYFRVRFFKDFTLLHSNPSGEAECAWSKPMRRRYNELTEAEHQAFGYEIVE